MCISMLFFSLLRLSIDSLQKKGILYIRQFVSNDEYESFLKNKTTWHIKNREEETLELICKLEDFLENFGMGIGLHD